MILFMKIALRKIVLPLLILALFLSGCDVAPGNANIANLDRQIKKVSDHIYSISVDGIYENSQVDLSLLDQAKSAALVSQQNLNSQYEVGEIDQGTQNEGIAKSFSLLHFIWMEEYEAAWAFKNSDRLLKLQNEFVDFENMAEIEQWAKERNLKNQELVLQDILSKSIRAGNLAQEIDQNNKNLAQLKSQIEAMTPELEPGEYNAKVSEYNNLVDSNQNSVIEYNDIISEYSPAIIYQSFLDLIQIDLIFPNQTELNLSQNEIG